MIKTKEISQYILNIENNYPVNEWVINNEIIWPFIRIKLFTDLNFANNKTFVRKSQSFKTTDNNKLKKLFKSVFSYNRLKQKDYFFTSTYAHRAKYNNKYWNKFYDPLVEDATISSYSIVEHNTKGYYSKKEEVNNYKQLFFFEDFHYSTDVISSKIKKLIPIIKDVNLPQYAHFYKQLKNDNLLNNRLENYELNFEFFCLLLLLKLIFQLYQLINFFFVNH